MSIAVRIWEDNFKILMKIRSKSERNALLFALVSYGFFGEIPQDLKLNKNNLILFDVLKNNFIAKNQGGAPFGNFNRCSTVEKKENNKNQPLSIKHKIENINTSEDKSSSVFIQKKTNFKKPTIEEVDAYCKERKNGIDAQKFFDFYESKGWLIGKTKMKDWKAAVRTWETKERERRTFEAARELIPKPSLYDKCVKNGLEFLESSND